MAIAEMRKLNLVAMSYDKDELLNALHRARAVEITLAPVDKETGESRAVEQLRLELSSVEAALNLLFLEVERTEKEKGQKMTDLSQNVEVSYSEFMSSSAKKAEITAIVEKLNALEDEKIAFKNDLQKLERELKTAEIYKTLDKPFAYFSDTEKTHVRLGTVSVMQAEKLSQELEKQELCAFSELSREGENALVLVATHNSQAGETDGVLSAYGFTACPYSGEQSGAQLVKELTEKLKALESALLKNGRTVYEMKEHIRNLKVYSDYLAFALEKASISDGLKGTERTFSLQAYLPTEAVQTVETELQKVSDAVYYEITEPTEDDEPPTLLKNNSVVGSFEPITNMYSPPNYREFDPNAVMGFFYSLFMGFIIGDMGYGLLMAIVGGLIWWKGKKTPSGLSRLSGAFAFGGVFALLWGALFNSFFGFAIFGKANTIMPDPQTGRCKFVGIEVPSVLVISLIVGISQLTVGYICKAVQCWRRGQVLDGVFDGIVWAFFSIGVALAIVGLVEELNVPTLATIGGVIAGVSLLTAMLTAGRHEKFFGKFTKGFGAAYGVINYASDILSYARLYGLMLSGAVIASIVSNYGGGFIVSGNIALAVLGVLLLFVGHGFNLVMNLLGAYIHDARLQYVEFYGRFFEGEGTLFKPLGSNVQYVRIK